MSLDLSENFFLSDYAYWDYCELAQKLNRSALLYSQAKPTLLSDEEYDRLFQVLLQIEKLHPEWIVSFSPSQRVDVVPVLGEKGQHQVFMGSLDNVFDFMGYSDWLDSALANLAVDKEDLSIIVEPKIDGLALSLIYEKGFLVDALTRGDGAIGERVLKQVRCIPSIPALLRDKDFSGLIRGEVFFKKEDFDKLNQHLKEKGEKTFSNPRNAAAGTLRQSDLQSVQNRPLSFLPYTYVSETHHCASYSQALAWCEQQGFDLNPWRRSLTAAESIEPIYLEILEKRSQLPFGIDGLVCKINNFSFQKELGETRRAPRWAIAWKLPADCVRSVLQNVVWQVGRLGHITPVAIFEPVLIDGVSVACATLHNQNEIIKKQIAIGQEIFVRRAGDVIPEVLGPVHLTNNTDFIPQIVVPTHCPSCENSLSQIDDHLYCFKGMQCLEQKLLRFAYAFGQDALNVPRLSYQTIKKAVLTYGLETPSQFYQLRIEDWMQLEGIAKKSAEYFYRTLRESLHTTEERFLLSCNVRHIGKATANMIFNHLSWEQFLSCSQEQLESIGQIGPIIAHSLHSLKTDIGFLKEYRAFQDYGLHFHPRKPINTTALLAGRCLCITGSFPDRTREQWKEWIEKNGGIFHEQLTKKTDLLLVGEKPGSKYEKAMKWGLCILHSEKIKTFLEIVEHHGQEDLACLLEQNRIKG